MDTPQKNTVRPSIHNNSDNYKDTAKQTKTETPANDIVWYLKNVCGGSDRYEFDTHEEAYKFGWKLRDQYGDKIRVEIAVTLVRIFAV